MELIKSCNFPAIPKTLIILMGVINSLYLGNEATLDPMKDIREKIAHYNKKERDEKEKLKEEIDEMLERVF